MERQRVSSCNTRSIGYNNSILEVEFNKRRVNQYNNTPQNIYHGIVNTSSHDSYLVSNIVNKFKYQEL
ncbi:KTSC domain-containing protein [Myroides albus]|uniref:KTSC domain-containing protein n=1 Tax=Myroides albus TaxID=2562892 RepID=UPI00358EC64C